MYFEKDAQSVKKLLAVVLDMVCHVYLYELYDTMECSRT